MYVYIQKCYKCRMAGKYIQYEHCIAKQTKSQTAGRTSQPGVVTNYGRYQTVDLKTPQLLSCQVVHGHCNSVIHRLSTLVLLYYT